MNNIKIFNDHINLNFAIYMDPNTKRFYGFELKEYYKVELFLDTNIFTHYPNINVIGYEIIPETEDEDFDNEKVTFTLESFLDLQFLQKPFSF